MADSTWRVSSKYTHFIHWSSVPEKEVNRKENKGGGGVGEIERRPQIWKFNHTQTSILAKCFLRDWNKATTWRFPFITCTLKGGWSKPWWLHVENCVKYFISFLWFVLKTTYLQVCLWGRDERLWFTSHNTGIKAFTFFITFSTA